MRAILIATALSVTTLAGTAARADTITLNVPIHVQKLMPTLASVEVNCHIFDSAKNDLAYSWSAPGVLDASGAYNGVLPVKITTQPGVAKAVSYRCFFALALPSGVVIYDTNYGGPAADDNGRPLPGTPFVGVVTGTIPTVIYHPQGRH